MFNLYVLAREPKDIMASESSQTAPKENESATSSSTSESLSEDKIIHLLEENEQLRERLLSSHYEQMNDWMKKHRAIAELKRTMRISSEEGASKIKNFEVEFIMLVKDMLVRDFFDGSKLRMDAIRAEETFEMAKHEFLKENEFGDTFLVKAEEITKRVLTVFRKKTDLLFDWKDIDARYPIQETMVESQGEDDDEEEVSEIRGENVKVGTERQKSGVPDETPKKRGRPMSLKIGKYVMVQDYDGKKKKMRICEESDLSKSHISLADAEQALSENKISSVRS